MSTFDFRHPAEQGKRERGKPRREVALFVAILFAAAAPAVGCARTSAAPPSTNPGGTEGTSPRPRGAVTDSGGTLPGTGSAASPPTERPGTLDPSEEITPEELRSIPEPVPGSSGGDEGALPKAPQSRALEDTARAERGAAGGTHESAGDITGSLWRVQIFATQDRALADRMAQEASLALGVKAYVAREGPQYKVRLGDYRSEQAALPLRELAVRSGFAGAFRIRCVQP